eukprot:990703-Pyramimonas_sp.AAC.1
MKSWPRQDETLPGTEGCPFAGMRKGYCLTLLNTKLVPSRLPRRSVTALPRVCPRTLMFCT